MDLPIQVDYKGMKFTLVKSKYWLTKPDSYISENVEFPFHIEFIESTKLGGASFSVYKRTGRDFQDIGAAPSLTGAMNLIDRVNGFTNWEAQCTTTSKSTSH